MVHDPPPDAEPADRPVEPSQACRIELGTRLKYKVKNMGTTKRLQVTRPLEHCQVPPANPHPHGTIGPVVSPACRLLPAGRRCRRDEGRVRNLVSYGGRESKRLTMGWHIYQPRGVSRCDRPSTNLDLCESGDSQWAGNPCHRKMAG